MASRRGQIALALHKGDKEHKPLNLGQQTKSESLSVCLASDSAIAADVADLEALQTAANTKLDTIANGQTQNGDGTGNKLGVMVDAINTNTITQNSKIDTTNTKLDTIANGQTQNGDGTGNKLGVMVDAINTNTITQNSKIDSTNTKLDTIDSVLDSIKVDAAAIKTAVELIDNTVSGNELQVDIVSGTISLPSGAATESTLADAEAHLGNIETKASSLAGCVSGTELQVDIVGAPTVTVSGTVTANAGTNLDTSALATQSTLADAETHLGSIDTKLDTIDSVLDSIKVDSAAIKTAVELIDNTVSGNELQVDIVSGAGDASVAKQNTMITKLGEIDTAQDLTNTKLDTIDSVLDSIKVDTGLVVSQQLLQASHLALHQTGTTNTTITIGNGANSDTKEVSLSDIRAAIVEPAVIGYHITSTGTGGSGSDVQMMISLDGSTFITLNTNISNSSKASFTGNLSDDNLGLGLVGQKFKFRITNNSGGSANYTVDIFAYGMDFAQSN